MNARITEIRQRNARKLFGMGLSKEQIAQREYAALLQETMLLTEAIDRLLLDMPCWSYSNFTLYGVEVQLVTLSGMDYEIYTKNMRWSSISELACEAAEYALENGYLHAQYLH